VERVFADAAYFIALLVPDDDLAAAARGASKVLPGIQIVTTDAVLCEYLAHVSAAGSNLRLGAARSVEALLVDPDVLVVRQDPALFAKALELYKSRLDKAYSLTDCMGMVICHEYGITDVLTHDRHFQQEGFTILL
jgi:predicted nucleic acid-binding protein